MKNQESLLLCYLFASWGQPTYIQVGNQPYDISYPFKVENFQEKVVVAERWEQRFSRRVTQHKIDVDFKDSAYWHQNYEMVDYNTTKSNRMVFKIWAQIFVSSCQKQRAEGKNQQMLPEKYYNFH